MSSSLSRRAARAASNPLVRALLNGPWWLALTAASCGAGAALGAASSPGPTVREVVEFTRFVQPRHHDQDALMKQVSPDGRHVFIVTRKTEVGTDRNVYRLLLWDLNAVDVPAGRAPPPRSLLTISSLKDYNYLEASIDEARWVGNHHIAFLGQFGDALHQVYNIDVRTGKVTAMTREARKVGPFAVSEDLRRVVYSVRLPNSPLPPGERSLVVGTNSFWSIRHGLDDLRAQRPLFQYFVADVGAGSPARPLGRPDGGTSHSAQGISVSPDGRWALLHHRNEDRHMEWSRRYPMVAEMTDYAGPSMLRDPLGYFSRPSHYVARSLVLYSLDDARGRPVLDAPEDATPAGVAREDRIWQRGGKSVVIAGTFLPPESTKGKPDTRSHVIEFWPDTGRWASIAPLSGRLDSAHAVPGRADAFDAIDAGKRRRFERQGAAGWKEVAVAAPDATAAAQGPGGLSLSVEQALNQPPELVASKAGQALRLTNLNPQFDQASWGVVRPYVWTDARGKRWTGGLMVPNDFDPARRYPLVIQAYGFSPRRFYLDGANGAEGFTSGFAGRAFLREGLLVLGLPTRADNDPPGSGTPESFADSVKSVIDALAKEGTVDRDRVGIMGFSHTGMLALNLITFTDAPIRSASLLDGDANTLWAMTVQYAHNDNLLAIAERNNRGMPFGEGRSNWVRNDPSLNTECIKAALRIETYGPWVLNNWDIYAFMRRQYKPVEMLVIPEGMHSLSRPSERMISLQGNVDWHRFWLSGGERTGRMPNEGPSALEDQYRRWHEMAELKKADDAKPRCASTLGSR